MNNRQKKISFVLKRTQDVIDRYLKELGLLEKSIIQKREQKNVLEQYKIQYSKSRLNQGVQVLSIMKSTYDFIGMIQKTLDHLQEEIDSIERNKQELIEKMQTLNMKKDTIEQYLAKISRDEEARKNKVEQKMLDEFSLHQFMKNLYDPEQEY